MTNNPSEQTKTSSGGPAMSAEERDKNKPNLQEKNRDNQISSPTSAINKITGTKRPVPVSPNVNLVYVRRKLDTEQLKKDENVIKDKNMQISQNPQNEKNEENEKIEKKEINDKIEENVQNEKNDKIEKIEKNVKNEGLIKPNGDWKERFKKLQIFLRNLDQSNQDDYMRMLRSLSSVGRSKHAVELEKRAIHLLLEEGKELQRMKILNVLGKNSQNNPAIQISSPINPQMER